MPQTACGLQGLKLWKMLVPGWDPVPVHLPLSPGHGVQAEEPQGGPPAPPPQHTQAHACLSPVKPRAPPSLRPALWSGLALLLGVGGASKRWSLRELIRDTQVTVSPACLPPRGSRSCPALLACAQGYRGSTHPCPRRLPPLLLSPLSSCLCWVSVPVAAHTPPSRKAASSGKPTPL